MWRGYLARTFAYLPFLKKYTVIGILWGLCIAFCIVMSLVLGLIAEQTQSVWSSAMLHGTFNGFSSVLSLLVIGGSPLIAGSAVGVVSLIVWLVVFLCARWMMPVKNEKLS